VAKVVTSEQQRGFLLIKGSGGGLVKAGSEGGVNARDCAVKPERISGPRYVSSTFTQPWELPKHQGDHTAQF
jgi:hypothetical protein